MSPEQAERKRERDRERYRVKRATDPEWVERRLERERERRREKYATDPAYAERARKRVRDRYERLSSTMEGRGILWEEQCRDNLRRRARRIAAHAAADPRTTRAEPVTHDERFVVGPSFSP